MQIKHLWVTRYFLRQWPLMIGLALFLLLTVGLQLGTPLILREFLDAISQQAGWDLISRLALFYIVAAFALRGVRVGESYLADLVAWQATNALRVNLVRHCLSLDLSFHLTHTPGELIERIDGDVGVLNNFFSRFVLILVTNTLIVLGVITILATIDQWLGLLLVGYGLLYVLTIFWLNTGTVVHFGRALAAEAQLFGFLEDHLSGTEDIRTSGAIGYVLRRLTGLMQQRLVKQQRAEVVQGLINILRMLLYVIGLLTGLAFAATLYRQGTITIGTAYLIFSYMTVVWDPLRDIVYQFGDFQKALAALRRLSALLSAQSAMIDGTRDALPTGPLAVQFENVSFAYHPLHEEQDARATERPTGEPTQALCGVSFQLAASRTLGILGETGSGKTTMTRLLLRFYDPQRGQIYLNGVDIRTVNRQALSSRIALVTQDVQLFHGMLRDNITFLGSYHSRCSGTRCIAETGFGGMVCTVVRRIGDLDPSRHALGRAGAVGRFDTCLSPAARSDHPGRSLCRVSIRIRKRLPEGLQRADHIIVLRHGKIAAEGTLVALLSENEEIQSIWSQPRAV